MPTTHSTSSAKKTYDIVIVGAGIMGLLTAYELASSNARILLIDQQQAGKESSWAGGGILSPLYPWRAPAALQPLFLWSLKNYPGLIDQLHCASGIDPEWLPSGLLNLAPTDAQAASTWAQENQLAIYLFNEHQLRENYSALSKNFHSALLLDFVAQVRNPRLLGALITTLTQHKNVTLLENQPVTRITTKKSQVTQLITPNDIIHGEQFIFCAGAWSQKLLKPLMPSLPIEPVLGQMLLLKPQQKLFTRILLHEDHYLIPRQDGLVLVGSTLERNNFDKNITLSAKRLLLDKAQTICPALKSAECVHHWSGLRPYAPDGIPFIGKISAIDNAWINAGHFRNGLTLAPASCRLLADLLLQRKPIIDSTPYQV